MVGVPSKVIEEKLAVDQEDPKVKTFKDTLDFPSIDSFLDFDSVNWLKCNRYIEEFSLEDSEFDFFEDEMEMGQDKVMETILESDSIMVKPELCADAEPVVEEAEPVVSDMSRPMESEIASVVDCPVMNLDESELKKTEEGLASSIEVELERVSLANDDDDDDDDEKSDMVAKGKTDSVEPESETTSSSSGSSDSSSSDSSEEEESDEEASGEEASGEEDNKKEKKLEDQMAIGKEDDVAGELEEGEIESVDVEDEVDDDDDEDDVNEMIAWSNDEDEDIGSQIKEPIRSKNELKELPPVPAVDVTLEPHHTTVPVGVVLSVMSAQVIVEGMEKHSPLTEGSILWITERRAPLGLVDEIFGPVKCPYYIVRFNSESEVPEGISQGTHVSFVEDFAQHILNIKELEKKGYDASGDNDEEVSDELEFSDDEKEAEYRRMQKMEKRGMMNDHKTGNTRNKKKKNRDLGRSTSGYSGEWTENQGSSNRSNSQMGGPTSNLHPRPQMDSIPLNSGGWRPLNNQLPPIPNQMGMPNLAQMQIPLMAMQNQMMFQPQFNDGQMPMPGGAGGLNFFPGQASAPWPSLIGQNCFNQQLFGAGRGIQQQPLLPNELNFNPFAPQPHMHRPPQSQMHRPQSPMNPQFQMQPQFPQPPMNPQYRMMHPQAESNIPHSPSNSQPQMQPHAQGFSSGRSSDQGRGHRGRGRGRGRGRFGRGRGRGRQQSE